MRDEESKGSNVDQGCPFGSHRLVVPLVLLLAAALGLAACGSSGSPHVASLEKSTGGGRINRTATTMPDGNATKLLDDWATCMRSHGDPNQPDPTIDVNSDIEVNWNPVITGGIYGTNKGGQGNAGPGQYCRSYLYAAQRALNGGQQPSPPDQATLLRYADCMRANGIADFPDPVNGTLSLNMGAGGDLDPNSPACQNVTRLCTQRTGAHVPGAGGTPPPGLILIDGAGPTVNTGANANG